MGKICNFIWNGIVIQCPDFQLDFLATVITNTAKYYLSIDNMEMYEETARLGNQIITELQVYQRERELIFSNIDEEWED